MINGGEMENKKMQSVEKKIATVKKRIAAIENFRSGSLSTQYNVCGKQGCKCKDKENPKKHGPYYQLSFYREGKHTTCFIKSNNVSIVKKEMENYRNLKLLFATWMQLATELSTLRMKISKK
jgi:hypothetical protein